jgi:hypothetical protein
MAAHIALQAAVQVYNMCYMRLPAIQSTTNVQIVCWPSSSVMAWWQQQKAAAEQCPHLLAELRVL